ncbi:MAG: hypothetical protein RLZZ117_779 [Cyanobacteriota bacterium]
MSFLRPRLDVLPERQQRLWPSLAGLARAGFVLYGGTAIAFRYGHRVSVDFDFFSDRPLDRQSLSRALPWLVTPRSRPATHARPNATKPSNHAKKPGIATRRAGVQVSSDSIQGEEHLSQRPDVAGDQKHSNFSRFNSALTTPPPQTGLPKALRQSPPSWINATPGSATLGLQRHLIEASFRVGKMPSFPPR